MKWAGGKTRLLPELRARLPERATRYREPFFGGGALFFDVQPLAATLSDVNDELVNVYRSVKSDVHGLIRRLEAHPYEKDHYYRMRATDPYSLRPLDRAARTVYLNRTCFNGLYRVNRRGQFNVPMGSYKNPLICPTDRLLAASTLLRDARIRCCDYREALEDCGPGDFVYFDPPYDPISKTANFTSYTAGAFDASDQVELANTFADLDQRGVLCMLSNSDTPFMRELYSAFRVEIVQAPRAISRDPNGRGSVNEVLVRNY